jgi:hypothetical protein
MEFLSNHAHVIQQLMGILLFVISSIFQNFPQFSYNLNFLYSIFDACVFQSICHIVSPERYFREAVEREDNKFFFRKSNPTQPKAKSFFFIDTYWFSIPIFLCVLSKRLLCFYVVKKFPFRDIHSLCSTTVWCLKRKPERVEINVAMKFYFILCFFYPLDVFLNCFDSRSMS